MFTIKISLDNTITIARDIEHAKEIIKEFEAAVLAGNRVISHYLVDGIEVADLDEHLNGPNGSYIQHIALVARTPQALVRDSVGTFLDYIPALQAELLAIKGKISAGEGIPEDNWHPLLDGLEYTNQFLNSLKNLVKVEGTSPEELALRWQEQLGAMLSAWESGDNVLLADIMEYEILEILGEIQSYFAVYKLKQEGH